MSDIGGDFKSYREDLEIKRVDYAINILISLGFEVDIINDSTLEFEFKGSKIIFYPYTGWHTGKTIKDGRGIKNLIKQIKTQENGKN